METFSIFCVKVFVGMETRKLNYDRVVAEFEGSEKGPLVIAFGALHGNEKAGVKALQYLQKMLEVEHITNPDFAFKGNLVGIIGNHKAYNQGERFIDIDINRHWDPEYISQIRSKPFQQLKAEDLEILQVLKIIDEAIHLFKAEKMYILDLHTTSSDGGIFTIPSMDEESQEIAKSLYATVIKGMIDNIKGTTLHYFNSSNFTIPTTAITFESGQHEDPKSVNRAIAAAINFLRTIGCVESRDVENIHDKVLKDFVEEFPKLTKLVVRHNVKEGDDFKMLPGFKNFQKVKKDDLLATDKNGNIYAPEDGRLLMPLYQKKGEDGFFLVKEEE